jgi:hypothetical protein
MKKKTLSPSKVRKITGASYSGPAPFPFYYAPPLLDALRDLLESRLSSSGGRPTLSGMPIVRKVRFSKESWDKLELMAKDWSQKGSTISPAQIASLIFEQSFTFSESKNSDRRAKLNKRSKQAH